MMPEKTELLVTYDSRWTWDFTTYLIELTVEVRTAHAKKLVSFGRYYQPNARPKPPETAARRLMDWLMGRETEGTLALAPA